MALMPSASMSSSANIRLVFIAVLVVVILWQLVGFSPPRAFSPSPKRPAKRIVGLVFYGRPRYVEILDCYLQHNLAVNGGVLDEVQFLVNTKKQMDIDYLDTIVEGVPGYRRVDSKSGYNNMWEYASDPDTIYVKIDDDVVWLAEDAIPRIVNTLEAHPDAYFVSSNILNSPVTQWFHYRTGAIRPFVPETSHTKEAAQSIERVDWRTSSLPDYAQPLEEHYDLLQQPAFEGSRLLPLPADRNSLKYTPMYGIGYGSLGPAWDMWATAAQQHYSFFYNLEYNALHKYWFGGSDDTWNLAGDHYNINLLAIRGKDVDPREMKASGYDDEYAMTEYFPKAWDRPALIDSKSLAVHFSYFKQMVGVLETDILARYRALAQETVCAGRLKGPEFRFENEVHQKEYERQKSDEKETLRKQGEEKAKLKKQRLEKEREKKEKEKEKEKEAKKLEKQKAEAKVSE